MKVKRVWMRSFWLILFCSLFPSIVSSAEPKKSGALELIRLPDNEAKEEHRLFATEFMRKPSRAPSDTVTRKEFFFIVHWQQQPARGERAGDGTQRGRGPEIVPQIFSRFDKDKDGKLTREEANSPSSLVNEYFDKWDADKDDVLTREEITASLSKERAIPGALRGRGVVVSDANGQDEKSIPVLQSDGDLKLKPGNNLLRINFRGVVRDLFIELPTDMQKGKRYPVVFGFHGDGGPKEAYNRRLSPYVKKFKIIGISIQGTPKRVGSGASSWDHHQGSDVDTDDIGFVQYLVDYLNKTERVDLKRVYATGGSSGGLFCYRLAKETKLFAAIGPTKCGMIKGAHEPDSKTAPLAIMQVIGNEDKSFNGSSRRLTMYSAEKRIEIWCDFLKCKPKPSINTKIEGMTIKTYVNDKGHEVVYCMLHGVGHSIPRSVIPVMDGLIVDFFMKHQKP